MVSGGAVLPDKGNRFRQSLQELKRTQTLVGEVSSDHHCLSSARSTPMSTPRSVSGMSVTSLGQLTPRPQPLPSTRAAAGDDIPVSVVVNIRPLVERERREGCQNCLHINLKDTVLPEVSVKGYSQRSFPFDQVYGEGAAPTADLFPECIAPLVEGLFNGFNATVLAYGQTGAGKTYTIGTHSEGKDSGRAWQAVIPQVTEMLFAKASELTEQDERSCVSFTASFFEVYQNSIRDLLAPRSKDAHIEIRERGGTDITLEGHTEMRVASPDELEHCLHRGVAARATHATNMNEHSSRSHAIFTITLNISKWRSLSTRAADFGDDSSAGSSDPGVDTGEEVEEKLSAKMHIVDLAGSERIKKSGVQGQQQKEAASINLGLLALRNCIEALCEPGRGHVPYRSNKLTRLLQDSLGGNARTVMVACVSPADSSMDETLNTLKYASSARNIKNKVVANRDEESSAVLALLDEVKMLREQLAALKAGTDGVGGDLTLLQAQRSSDTAVRIASLEEDRDSWRMRATVAESRCAELHAELQGLKNEHCASTASNGGGASPGLDLTPGQNPLFVSSGTGMGASPYTAERPLPFSAPRPASASSPNLEHSSPLQLQSAGSSEMDPLRPAEPLPASSAWRPLPDGESEGSASCRGATAGSSPKGISTRSISRNDLFEDIAFGIESPASGRWPNATEVLEMPMFQRAKMEHEQQVLTRKRDEATLLCTRLESLPGSVLRDGDGRLEPPKSKQTLDEWVNSAVVLDTQAADLKQILDAKMASRAACSHELSAIERHIQVLGRQVEEQQGEAEEVANDPAVSQRLQQLEALARELRETIGRHNSSIAQFQTFYLNLQDQIEKEGASQQAFRSRFQWVAQKDLKDVMAAVYRLTKKQREQLLDLRSDNVHLREEVAWRDTVLQLFANEIDDARTCETQLREELHRAASEKVRILDLYGVSQQEKGHLEERLVQAESGLERLHEAYTAALRELNQERSVSANLRGSLAELNDAAVQLAEEKERVLGTPGWHYDTAAAGEFPTPAGTSLIEDDVRETLERAAVEKTKLAQKLSEKEELLFFLAQQIPKVENLRAQWESRRSKRSKGESQARKLGWRWPSQWGKACSGNSRPSHDGSTSTPQVSGGASPCFSPFHSFSDQDSHLLRMSIPRSEPQSSAEGLSKHENETEKTDQLLSTLKTEALRQEEAIANLQKAYSRLQEAKDAGDRALQANSNISSPVSELGQASAERRETNQAQAEARTALADCALPCATRENFDAGDGQDLTQGHENLMPASECDASEAQLSATNATALGQSHEARRSLAEALLQAAPGCDGLRTDQGMHESEAVQEKSSGAARDDGDEAQMSLFSRLARKKAQRSNLPPIHSSMVGRLNIREIQEKLVSPGHVQKPLAPSFSCFDDKLPPQGQQGYVVKSVDILETITRPQTDSPERMGLRRSSSCSRWSPDGCAPPPGQNPLARRNSSGGPELSEAAASASAEGSTAASHRARDEPSGTTAASRANSSGDLAPSGSSGRGALPRVPSEVQGSGPPDGSGWCGVCTPECFSEDPSAYPAAVRVSCNRRDRDFVVLHGMVVRQLATGSWEWRTLEDFAAEARAGGHWRESVKLARSEISLDSWLRRRGLVPGPESRLCSLCFRHQTRRGLEHPEFRLPLCRVCHDALKAENVAQGGDADGAVPSRVCAVCRGVAPGGTHDLRLCVDCGIAYCTGCLWRFTSEDVGQVHNGEWSCFLHRSDDDANKTWLLRLHGAPSLSADMKP